MYLLIMVQVKLRSIQCDLADVFVLPDAPQFPRSPGAGVPPRNAEQVQAILKFCPTNAASGRVAGWRQNWDGSWAGVIP
jgi:hypothetical protein